MFNKRGQEGFSFTAILGLVVGVVALVMIALFVYNIFGRAGTTLELLPGEEASASQVCSLVAGSGEANLICDDFKELKIGGKDRMVNCKFVSGLFSEKPDWAEKIKTNCPGAEAKYCEKQSEVSSKGILVNGGICIVNGTTIKKISDGEPLTPTITNNTFYEGYERD